MTQRNETPAAQLGQAARQAAGDWFPTAAELRAAWEIAEGIVDRSIPAALGPRKERLQELCRELLIELGEDPDRPGIADTPRRWADWWLEFIEYKPGTIDTTFEQVTTDQIVIVGPMRVFSLCEHHLLPFWCDITVAYIAEDKVLGLSKFARIAHLYAHRLQLQERLTHQIADDVQRVTSSNDVMVVGRGQHLCMSMRGIKTDAIMANSVVRGRFRDLPALRAEALSLIAR
jgi:GTP cyclohydrolase IA